MAYPVAANTPSYSGTLIPNLFSKQFARFFYLATIMAAICTTEYEGQISKMGDTIRVRKLPATVPVHSYTKNAGLQADMLDPEYVDLDINKGQYFNLKDFDVDRAQADIAYSERWAEHASKFVKIAIDADVLANTYSSASAYNKGATAGKISQAYNLGTVGTPLGLTTSNIVGVLVDLGTVLSEQNIPPEDRWIALPAWATNLIKKSELKDASLSGDGTSMLRNGRIGMIDGMTIYQSNNLSYVTDASGPRCFNCMGGHKVAMTFAAQLDPSTPEKVRNQSDFGDFTRALTIYGYQVVHPEALSHLYVYKA
ncbi:MAG TPA: hypothetical protein PLG73_09050 [Candidatus Sumerlaeota bacterium]|nr:hypothetical protein [Candidatus Sumerlaeota bacterium]